MYILVFLFKTAEVILEDFDLVYMSLNLLKMSMAVTILRNRSLNVKSYKYYLL